MPATKLIKIRIAVMRQNTKIRGLRDILTAIVMMASITMPLNLRSGPLPEGKEWVVVIDAGHGGKDPGTHGAKSVEKSINLAVALKTGKYISEYLKDVKVIYTRDDDTFPGLDERANVANKNKADVFISIHSNWISDKQVTGAETYVLGQTMDEANLQVAMKENSVITFEEDYQTKYEGYDPNSVESFIIFSLMQNTYLKQSTEFASLIQKQFKERVGRKDRGVRQAGFIVLWRTTMPSVLIELGYVSNSEEEKYLMSEQGQDYLASAIFRAFRDYKASIDNRSGMEINGIASSTASVASTEAVSSREDDTRVTQTPVVARSVESPSLKVPEGQKANSQDPAGSEVLFMVQISAVPRGREMSSDELRGIAEITRVDDGERIKYAAGKFRFYDEAVEYRKTLTARFPDAFVIAVKNGIIVPLKEAVAEVKTK
jgi:N-acetylmuramoyl-L-alanine amidase